MLRRSATASSVGPNSFESRKRVTRSACKREIAANRLASSRPHGARGGRSTERAQKAAKAFANTRWLGCRCANESVKPNRSGVDEMLDPLYGLVGRDLHETVPASEHFE